MVVDEWRANPHSRYLSLEDADSGKALDITDEGCVITKKMSMLLNIKKGDVIEYELDGEKTVELKVTGIAENYALHYVYITGDTFKSCLAASPFTIPLMSTSKTRRKREPTSRKRSYPAESFMVCR